MRAKKKKRESKKYNTRPIIGEHPVTKTENKNTQAKLHEKKRVLFFYLLLVPILTIGNALVKHETFNALHAEFHVQEGHQCRKRRRGHRAFHEVGLR